MEEKLAALLAQVLEAGGTPISFAVPADADGAPAEYEGVPVMQPDDQTVFALVFNDGAGDTQVATMRESTNMSGESTDMSGEPTDDAQPSV